VLRLILLLVLSLFSVSCGYINSYLRGSDNRIPPAKLMPIERPIAIQALWSVQVGRGQGKGFIRLAPAVDGGRVYAASHDGVVMAIDAGTGQIIWNIQTKLPISAGAGLGDDVVLVGTEEGEVLALDRQTGKEAWRAKVSSEVLAAPRAAQGIAVVRTADGKFIGLDARSGEQRWLYSYTVPALTLRGSAPPVLDQGLVISGLETGRLLVLSLANGAPVSTRMIAPPRGRTELNRMVDIDTEPRVIGAVLYVTAYQGNITAIDLRSGNTLWSRDFSSFSGLEGDDRRVYVPDENDALWALDRLNGDTLWQQEALTGRFLSRPALVDDYVVVGDYQGYLHWLAKSDGRLVGRLRADRRGIAAAPVVQGDILFVLGKGGALSAFRAG